MIATSNAVGYASESASLTTNPKAQKEVLGKDDFMNLFVTQLQNQNPLEPMDNAQFLSQMAQFSSLEQMQNISKAMELLTLSQSASTNSQMISLIGKRVISPGNQFTMQDGKPLELIFNIPPDTPPLKMEIVDKSGAVVRSIIPTGLKPGFNNYQFDGLNEQGEPLAAGQYEYRFARADGKQDKVKVETFSNLLIDSVAFGSNSTILKSGGISVPLEEILEVRSNVGG